MKKKIFAKEKVIMKMFVWRKIKKKEQCKNKQFFSTSQIEHFLFCYTV